MSGFLVDITLIKTNEGSALPVDVKSTVIEQDYEATVRLSGNAVNECELTYRFSGRLTGIIDAFCAKCLSPISLPYDTDVDFAFSSSDGAADDVLLFKGNTVDFGGVVAGFIRADVPISFVCDDGCKGLCEKCGQNLNIEACTCEKELINPVLNKLHFR